MKEQFKLSDKRNAPKDNSITRFRPYYDEEDVKEFIRLLKEKIIKSDMLIDNEFLCKKIDALAGEDLK